jgi:hypothetical protein
MKYLGVCSLLMMWYWLTSEIKVNQKLELWRCTLESKCFRLNMTKTEYMTCQFSGDSSDGGDVRLDRQVPVNDIFWYLGSMLQSDRGIEEDISHKIRAVWMKCRRTSDILYDKKVPNKLKDKFYKTMIRLGMIYGAECWATKGQHIQKMCSRNANVTLDMWSYKERSNIKWWYMKKIEHSTNSREVDPTLFVTTWSYPMKASWSTGT